MKPTVRNIVLGFDFSPGARAALEAADHLGLHANARLHIVTSAHGAVDDRVVDAVANGTAELRDQFLRRVEGYVRSQVEAAFHGQGEVGYHITLQQPASHILAVGAEIAADLVIVGNVGNRTPTEGHQVGVDVQRLARNSSIPVLVARPGVAFPPKRVLCAVDFSNTSAHAAELAAALTRMVQGTIDLLHIMPTASAAPLAGLTSVVPEEFRRAHHTVARREMSDFLAHVDLNGIVSRVEIAEGVPHELLLGRAAEGAYDLIALGTVGRKVQPVFGMGSTAERIVRDARTNLLLLRA